jgi:FkbM family methyltransferase
VPVVTLPNGLVLEMPPNELEATFLYDEIFENGIYLKHGLEVRDGDCVFDIGANVGLFSVALAQRHEELRLVLFEPVPATFGMLHRNVERLLQGATVTLVQAGVSSSPGTAVFEFNPMWTGRAGASHFLREMDAAARSARREVGVLAWNHAATDDGVRAELISERTGRRLHAALDNPVLRPFTLALIWSFWRLVDLRARRRRQRFECRLTTISAAMREYGIDRVDLVKIDAEGAEWAILQGIEPSDWPRIRQLALEVHDIDGRVERMRGLLEERGYEVTVPAPAGSLLELAGVRMLYARR